MAESSENETDVNPLTEQMAWVPMRPQDVRAANVLLRTRANSAAHRAPHYAS